MIPDRLLRAATELFSNFAKIIGEHCIAGTPEKGNGYSSPFFALHSSVLADYLMQLGRGRSLGMREEARGGKRIPDLPGNEERNAIELSAEDGDHDLRLFSSFRQERLNRETVKSIQLEVTNALYAISSEPLEVVSLNVFTQRCLASVALTDECVKLERGA